MSFDAEVKAFLASAPELARPMPTAEQRAVDQVRWTDRPLRYSCFCCRGSGLVPTAVMQRFVSAAYTDAHPPVICNRSQACGHERIDINDPEAGPRRLERHRYEHLMTSLRVLPVSVANAIDAVLREEARAAAMDPDRGARAAAIAAIRTMTAGGRRWHATEVEPDGAGDFGNRIAGGGRADPHPLIRRHHPADGAGPAA